MDGSKALALFDFIADLLMQDNADGEIYLTVLRGSAAAEVHRHKTDMLGKDAPDIARDLGRDFELHLCIRQTRSIIDVIAVTVLCGDHFGKLLERRAAFNRVREPGACVLDAFGDTGLGEDAAAERQAQREQVALSLALEDGNGFLDLDGVADGTAEGLVHIGDDSGALASGEPADARQAAGKLLGFVDGLHKGAVAALDVEDDDVRPGGQLL